MSSISLQSPKEIGAFLITTALSCGPSQLFGCIKLIVDSCFILTSHYKRNRINSNVKKIQNDWSSYKTSSKVNSVAKKLNLESDTLTQKMALNYFNTKNRYTEENIKKLSRSIHADVCAMIPFIGAHLSWRIATDYKGKSFTPIFSRAIQQLLEHSKTIASRPLFLGRKSQAANRLEDHEEYIEVSTSTKNRKIEIYYTLARELNSEGDFIAGKWTPERKKTPTVVLFHPNMGRADKMSESAEFYREKGYNTLAVTLGGYQGSPGVTTSEKSMYQDIEAIKKFLADMGVKEVAYHGFSLGSGAAMQAAAGESLVKDLKTLFVVLDQPYTSAAEVGNNVAGPLGKGTLTAGCPRGLDVELPGGLWTKTDGLNNLEKINTLRKENIPLMCFEAEDDFLMGRKKKNGEYTENFARDLLHARYGDTSNKMKNLVTLPGGHGFNSLNFTRLWDTSLIPSAIPAN